MTLSFTAIPDRTGLAVYCLYDGTATQQRSVQRLVNALTSMLPRHQILILSAKDPNGEKIRDFYDLHVGTFPHVLLVKDNDELASFWSGSEVPSAEVIAHTVRTISEV